MKKVFLFLAILMLSLSGVLFACGEDNRYENLKVELVSIVDNETGNALPYDSENGCYQVFYGKDFTVSAKVNLDDLMIKNLEFTAQSDSALQVYDEEATTAKIKPLKPSHDEKFKLTVSSVEMLNKGSLDLYFKVLLPVTEISFKDGLGVMLGKPIDLTNSIQFVSSYGSGFEFDKEEKQIAVSLDSYIDSENNTLTLSKNENDTYYLKEKPAFKIEKNEKTGNSILAVLDDSLKGKVNVIAKSSKFVEGDTSEANQKLITSTSVKVIALLELNDISFSSNQTSFYAIGQSGQKIKLGMALYSFPTNAEYVLNGQTYLYSKEQIAVTVNTPEDYTVEPIITDDTGNTSDVIKLTASSQEGVTTTFVFEAKNNGKAYIDFVVKFKVANEVEFVLSDMYKAYKDANPDFVQGLNDRANKDLKNNKIEVDVYALPRSVKVSQDGKPLQREQVITIYDSYGENYDDSFKMTKFELDLEGMKDSNSLDRTIRVQIVNKSTKNLSNLGQFFEIYDINRQKIDVLTLNDEYYFDLDIGANPRNKVFYVKANNATIASDNKFGFVFKNLVKSKLTLADRTEIEPTDGESGLGGQKLDVTVLTAKGVSQIVVKNVIESEGTPHFYDLTAKDDGVYNKLVLEYGNNTGTIVAFFYDKDLVDDISVVEGNGIVNMSKVSSTTTQKVFDTAYDKETLQLGGVIQVNGIKLGKSTITFSAKNGFYKTIDVEVVGTTSNFNLKLADESGQEKLTENYINDDEKNYASVMQGGKLRLSLENEGQIIGVSYSSSASDIASITPNGEIDAKTEGTATITAVVKYYKFSSMTNNYFGWEVKEETLSFNLNVFIKGVWSINTQVESVYDYNTVAYDNVSQATFRFHLDMNNESTVYKERKTRVKFVVENSFDILYIHSLSGAFINNNEIYGDTFSGWVTLGDYTDQDKIIVVNVYIDEFGLKIDPIPCKIVISKACQVKDIEVSASTVIDNVSTDIEVSEMADFDEISVRKNSTIDLATLLNGTKVGEDIKDNRLLVYIAKADSNENESSQDEEMAFGAIYKKNGAKSYRLDLAGEEKFYLDVKDCSGVFYLVIIAKDSYINETTYNTYKRIKIAVEDGNKHEYTIRTASQLKAIENEPTKSYQLGNNIFLDENWVPISNFSGVLNGNGYFISGLKLGTVSENGTVGLFGEITTHMEGATLYYGTVYNLIIKDASININDSTHETVSAGIIAGENNGIILNVAVKYTNILANCSSNKLNIGSFAGLNNGVILNYGVELSFTSEEERNEKYFSNGSNAIYSQVLNGNFRNNAIVGSAIALNYSNGTSIVVSSEKETYVGGVVGVNKGVIDGYYGLQANGSEKVNYVTYNQKDVDGFVNINTQGGSLLDENSAIGGVAGVNYGRILNFAVEGNIGGFDRENNKAFSYTSNNIGGIAGANLHTNATDYGIIMNVLTSVKVAGKKNIGGVAGVSKAQNTIEGTYSTTISNAKVENYDTYSSAYYPMIVGETNVGGLVGNADYVKLNSAYSNGYTQKFENIYVSLGDMFVYGLNANAGGLVGKVDSNIELGMSFSTFNIVSANKSSFVKGLIGGNGSYNANVNECFYIGVISTTFDAASDASVVLGLTNPKFYYVLTYADKNDLENGTEKNCFVGRFVSDSIGNQENPNILFDYYPSLSEALVKVEKHTDLLSDIPSQITVVGNGKRAVLNDDTFVMTFGSKYYHYETTDSEGKTQNVLVLGLGENTSSYNLNDIFTIKTTNEVSKINIIASELGGGVVRITDSGELVLLKTGITTLNFAVKENTSINAQVTLVVVENFDSLRLSPNGSMSVSYFDSADETQASQVRNGELVNFNYDFVEVVNDKNKEINNYTNYDIEYTISYKENADADFKQIELNDAQYLTMGAKTIRFNKIGLYKLSVAVFFEVAGVKYRITNDNWVFYIESKENIVDIGVNVADVKLSGSESVERVMVFVYTQSELAGAPKLNISITRDVDGTTLTSRLEANIYDENEGSLIYDLANSPFQIILVPSQTPQGKTYRYSLELRLKQDAFIRDIVSEYIVTCSVDGQDGLEDDFRVYVSPSPIKDVETSHYSYTSEVSKLVKANDKTGETTTFYSYSKTKKNSIISGMGGLFVIDLLPYYANITSVSIESTGSDGLSFVQLVKVRDKNNADTMYYLAGPSNDINSDGSVSLRLISLMNNAVLDHQDGTSVLIGDPYSFSFGGEADDASVGRLYVRTIAPSSLVTGDKINIVVKIKYMGFDPSGRYTELEARKEHQLEVVEPPMASIKISHDNETRKIIAYTATGTENATTPDYLDIVANVETGFKYALTYSVISDGKDRGQNADYAILEETASGYTLKLGKNARIGDKITIKLAVEISTEDGKTTQIFEDTISVVDAVVTDISINGLDDNNVFNMTISSSKQLRVKINGYGTNENLQAIENRISRAVAGEDNLAVPYYWFIENPAVVDEYVKLSNANTLRDIPFSVNQLSTGDQADELMANSDNFGASGTAISYKMNYNTIYLEGLINAGSANLMLEFSYVYNNGSLQLIPLNSSLTSEFSARLKFTVYVASGDEEEDLVAIATVDDFDKLKNVTGGHFILTNDLVLENYEPFEANFESFDGNNKVITIKNFSLPDPRLTSSTANIGLFSTIASNTIVKNLIVAIPNSKRGIYENGSNRQYITNLEQYSTVNFGGIAGINNGLITNCDVVAIKSNLENGYVVNFLTTSSALVNVGGLVGANSGIITNSRVGRKDVDILKTSYIGSVVASRTKLQNTTNFTMALYGGGNVGGFAGVNLGTISSSFAENLQLEVYSASGTTPIKTAGFVVTNSGYIYGSYASGVEEGVTGNYSVSRKLGGGIFSNGLVSGFVFTNENYIADCYSNINLSGNYEFALQTERVLHDKDLTDVSSSPAVAGFVYVKGEESIVKTSYSLSRIKSNNSYGPFESPIGVPLNTNSAQVGTIENCYYLREEKEDFPNNFERAKELSDNAIIDTEATTLSGINQFALTESFNGFSFDPEIEDFSNFSGQSSGGVWAIRKGESGSGYPELISASTIAISSRILNTSKTDGSNKKFFTYVVDYELGSLNNPYLISTAEQYNKIFSDYADNLEYENTGSKYVSNIRLINNLNFEGLEVKSTSIEFTSITGQIALFDGNYLTMTGLSLQDTNEGSYAFGLFKDIYRAGVKNLTLGILEISAGSTTAVGGLAGVIVDSNISNISLVPADSGKGEVFGRNYVGALAGIITSSDPARRIDEDKDKLYYISNINSTLSIKSDQGVDASSTLTTAFRIWQNINPVSDVSGVSSSAGNLRLNNLNTNVAYAGGVAGVIDLRQVYVTSGSSAVISKEVAYNIHVGEFTPNTSYISASAFSSSVKILSNYVGGLFGMIGSQTMVARSEFIVNEDSSLSAYKVAGGLSAFNYGMISKSFVSHNKDDNQNVDEALTSYVDGGTEDIQINTTLYSKSSEYTPRYIGGLVGINAGSLVNNSGSIIDSYNRVDVRNPGSVAVGGIVGGSYVGELRNVYTTASLLGNTNATETVYIGGIIGRIFDRPTENFFVETASGNKILNLSNIVAMNIYSENDFDLLYEFVTHNDGAIGALYGKYANIKADGTQGIVRIDQGAKIYFNQYALRIYDGSDIFQVGRDATFNVGAYITQKGATSLINLWGACKTASSINLYDKYLANYMEGSSYYVIQPHQLYRFLKNDGAPDCAPLRNLYFGPLKWSRDVWSYNDSQILPTLDYGYKTSVRRIYTAQEFIDEVSSSNNSEMTYLIMNDLDFSTTNFTPINKTFGGRIIGSQVQYVVDGVTYSRYPILFNLDYSLNAESTERSSYAIFEHASNATISNLNIVVKNYDVSFRNDLTTTAKASTLIALAEGVTLSNVNVYSSLLGKVSMVASKLSYASSFTGNYGIAQGLAIDSETGKYTQASVGYLRTEFNDETRLYLYKDTEFVIDSVTTEGGLSSSTTGIASIPVNVAKIKTNAECFGGLIASTGESTVVIENCSSNIDVEIVVTSKLNNAYYGTIIGEGNGKIRRSIASGEAGTKLSIQSNYSPAGAYRDVENMYVGGVAGFFKGELDYIYIDNLTITVGGKPVESKSEKAFIVNTPRESASGGAYIGGVVGSASTFTASKDYTSGSLSEINVSNIRIETTVKGQLTVGGVVARNVATISGIYIRNLSSGFSSGIIAHIDNGSARNIMGGVVGENTTSLLSDVYSNLSINTISSAYASLYVGGILGQTASTMALRNVVSDAKAITLDKLKKDDGYDNLDLVVVGGVVASATSLEVRNILSAVDIIASQDREMTIGGAIGNVGTVSTANAIVLGNILLRRGMGVDKDSYFYLDEASRYNIGGFIGNVETSFAVLTDNSNQENLILSTIRDYAIGQKLEVYEGSVIGGNLSKINFSGPLFKVYYNENISLVANNNAVNLSTLTTGQIVAGADDFTSIDQDDSLIKLFKDMISNFTYSSGVMPQSITFVEGTSTTFFNNYYRPVDKEPVVGSKLAPQTFEGAIPTNNTYYVLKNDLTLNASISATSGSDVYTGWIINCRGFAINVTNNKGFAISAFNEITENSAVVGMLVTISEKVDNSFSAVAKTNNGFIFSCGISGKITNNSTNAPATSLTSLVFNNFGVISRSFSTAELSGESAFGLVVYNGHETEKEKVGNIYDSFFTGSIIDKAVSDNSIFAGIALQSYYGVMSNSYTMADIESTKVDNIYPIMQVNFAENPKQNLYRTFYDYIAYLGSFEGAEDGVEKTRSIASTDSTNKSFLTVGGIYAWSTTFSGDITKRLEGSEIDQNLNNLVNTVAKSMTDLFQTNWIGQSNKNILIETFVEKVCSLEDTANADDARKHLDNTWFNYGYISKDLRHVYVGENASKYFQMLYSGNGLAGKENATGAKKSTVKGFLDQPYSVKHGGLLDMLVTENCLLSEPIYRHYLFTRNISLKKYNNLTYWSESWDLNNAVFIGDLDGDGKLVSDMFSTYGLVRAIPNAGNTGLVTKVRNIVFNGCYSKTGLVAGYMGAGEISGIKVLDSYMDNTGVNYVYNGNLFDTKVDGEEQSGLMSSRAKNSLKVAISEITIKENNEVKTKRFVGKNRVNGDVTLFAGGLVGYMTDGLITDIEINGLNIMAYNRIGKASQLFTKENGYNLNITSDESLYNGDISYAGGLVGIMTGGEIKGTQNVVRNGFILASDKTANNGVDILGGAGDIVVRKLTVASSFNDQYYLQPFSYVGGIVGYLGKESNNTNIAMVSNIAFEQNYISDPENPSETKETAISIYGMMSLGGFAGIVDGGKILACSYNLQSTNNKANKLRIGYGKWTRVEDNNKKSVNLSLEDMSGGMAGVTGIAEGDFFSSNGESHTVTILINEIYVGGIAGSIYSGTISYCKFDRESAIYMNTTKLSGYGTIMVGGIVGESYESKVSEQSILITNVECKGSISISGAIEIVVGGIIGRMRNGIVQNVTFGGDDTTIQLRAYSSELSAKASGYIDWANGSSFIRNSDQAQSAFDKYIQTIKDNWADSKNAWEHTKTIYKAIMDFGDDNYWNAASEVKGLLQVSFTAQSAVAGGVVGKLISGNLEGDYNKQVDGTYPKGTEYTGDFKFGQAGIYSTESSGGVVGKILYSGNSVSIKNIEVGNKISVYSAGTISLVVKSQTYTYVSTGVSTNFDDVFKKGLKEDMKAVIDADSIAKIENTYLYGIAGLGLSKSSSGGIVGYIKYQSSSSTNEELIAVSDCATHGSVGSVLATYVGGIVGLISDTSGLNKHTMIKNSTSSSLLRGYLLKSFAGGIVGYLNTGTIYKCNSYASFSDASETIKNMFNLGSPNEATNNDNWKTFLESFASILIGIPNISGGIVGYCEGGVVRACSTGECDLEAFDFGLSFVLGVRVAGGIVGVAAGGTFTAQEIKTIEKDGKQVEEYEFGIMQNNGIVYSLYGIAGGLFGVVSGASVEIVGYQNSNFRIADILGNTVSLASSAMSNGWDGFEETFTNQCKNMLGLNDSSIELGLLINNYLGIVFGQVSGGIVGYYDTNNMSTISKKALSGCINLGRVYSNIMSAWASVKTMASMLYFSKDVSKMSNSAVLMEMLAGLSDSNFEVALNEYVSSFHWEHDKVDDIQSTIEDGVSGASFSAGLIIDGEKVSLLDIFTGAALNSLFPVSLNEDNTFFTSEVEIAQDIIDLVEGITVFKYHHDPNWKLSDMKVGEKGIVSYGLLRKDTICKIVDKVDSELTSKQLVEQKANGLIVFEDYYPDAVTINEGEKSKVWIEPTVKGFGASGGIVGMINGYKNTGKLTINLTLSWTLTEVFTGAFASSVITSNGIAGGIVGVAGTSAVVTSSINFTNVIGRMAGGIVGLGNEKVKVLSYQAEATTETEVVHIFEEIMHAIMGYDEASRPTVSYGPVFNTGMVNGSLFAGGIFGYANGAQINSPEMEELFYRDHSFGVYLDVNGNNVLPENWETLIDGLNIKAIGNLNCLSVVNAGSVFSNRFAGGIVGYSTGESGFYNAKTTGNWFRLLGGLISCSDLRGTISGVTAWHQYDATLDEEGNSVSNACLFISAPYSGGIAGYLDDGVIGGSCKVGTNDAISIKIKISAHFYDPNLDNMSDSEREEYKKNNKAQYAGGFAGGVVGVMAGGTLGTTYVNNGEIQRLAISVGHSTMFGLTQNFIIPYVGGVVGCYAVPYGTIAGATKTIGNVLLSASVSNGLFTGGVFGKIWGNSNIDISLGALESDDPYIIGTPLEYDGSGKLKTTPSERLVVDGFAGTICGGLIGYLENSTIKNVLSCVKITGSKGSTMGGVVGWLNGGKITNCVVSQLTYKEITVTKKDEGTGKTQNVKKTILAIDWDTKDKNGKPDYLFDITNALFTSDDVKDIVAGYFNNDTSWMNGGALNLARFMSESYIGGIAGRISSNKTRSTNQEAVIQNCVMYANMQGGSNVGGIVGHMIGKTTVTSCYNFGSIERAGNVGGIVGLADSYRSEMSGQGISTLSPLISAVYVGRELLVSDGVKAGGLSLTKSILNKDGTSTSVDMGVFNVNSEERKIYMYDDSLLVLDLGASTEGISLTDLKDFFGVGEKDSLQSITGSMSAGGFVGVMKGYSRLWSGKAGTLVKVATEVDSNNKLENLKQMVLSSYGDSITEIFGDKFSNIDGVGVAGGAVGTATENARVGLAGSTEASFWESLKGILKDIFGTKEGSDGFLQGAGTVNGWIAGGLVGKLSQKASIDGGTTGLFVRGEIYAGGVVGFMNGDHESKILNVRNYSVFNAELNGVFALGGETLKIIDDVASEDGTTEDNETDALALLKTSLGGIVGYYTGQGLFNNAEISPMPIFGLDVAPSIALDKYFAGSVIGHLHNGYLSESFVGIDLEASIVMGTLSYAGSLVGRVSGTSLIKVDVNNFTQLGKFSEQTVQAVKGAGGLVGAITSNSKFSASGEATIETSKVTLNSASSFGATLVASLVGGAVGGVLEDSELILEGDFKVSGDLKGLYIGGLVGIVKGKITGNGHAISIDYGSPFGGEKDEKGNDKLETLKDATMGGVVGALDSGEIVNIKNRVEIKGSQKATVGGIVGLLAGGSILDCENSTKLSLVTKGDNGTSGVASSITPWSDKSEKGNSTNVINSDGKAITSYKEFKDAGYHEGSIGGIAGRSTRFALSTILTTTDLSSVDEFITNAKIENCSVASSVDGYFFYGNDSEKIEERSCTGDEVHTTHIADKRGQYVGSVDKLSILTIISPNGDSNVKRQKGSSFDLEQLTSADGIIKLLSTKNVENLVSTTLSADYIYATSAQWKDRNKEIDDESLKENAYIVGYKLLTRSHTFTQVNDEFVESVKDEYAIYLKKSVSNDIKHITTLEEGRQFNPITEGYPERYVYRDAKPSDKHIKFHAQTKALEGGLTDKVDNGVVVVDLADGMSLKEGPMFSNKDEKGPNEDYEEYMFTTITCELTTLSVFIGGTYGAMQYCGGDIEMTRNALKKKGYMSDQAQKALLLDMLYLINTDKVKILEVLDSDFKIHSTLLG